MLQTLAEKIIDILFGACNSGYMYIILTYPKRSGDRIEFTRTPVAYECIKQQNSVVARIKDVRDAVTDVSWSSYFIQEFSGLYGSFIPKFAGFGIVMPFGIPDVGELLLEVVVMRPMPLFSVSNYRPMIVFTVDIR